MFVFIYRLLINILGPVMVLAASVNGRFGGWWTQRLGLDLTLGGGSRAPRIWLHGVSVGEVRSAGAVVAALLKLQPGADIYLSSSTPAGLKTAEELAKNFSDAAGIRVMAAPLDFWGGPRRVIRRVRPVVLVIMETELWPNLILAAHHEGVKLMLAAGRLTERSFKRYRMFRKIAAAFLTRFDLVAASSERDRQYFADLGVSTDRLKVMGSPKFDGLLAGLAHSGLQACERQEYWAGRIWGGPFHGAPEPGLCPGLIVAGSTHPGEEEIILDAFKGLLPANPNLILLLAPRHLNRVGSVRQSALDRGLTAAAVSEAQGPLASQAKVLVLDVMGQLPYIYALATVALVGGSLLKGQGHNPLEPASVGVPVLFGPYMGSFAREAEDLLKAGAAVEIVRPDQLGLILKHFLASPEAARQAGEAGRQYTAALEPVGPVLAQAALNLIG